MARVACTGPSTVTAVTTPLNSGSDALFETVTGVACDVSESCISFNVCTGCDDVTFEHAGIEEVGSR